MVNTFNAFCLNLQLGVVLVSYITNLKEY